MKFGAASDFNVKKSTYFCSDPTRLLGFISVYPLFSKRLFKIHLCLSNFENISHRHPITIIINTSKKSKNGFTRINIVIYLCVILNTRQCYEKEHENLDASFKEESSILLSGLSTANVLRCICDKKHCRFLKLSHFQKAMILPSL